MLEKGGGKKIRAARGPGAISWTKKEAMGETKGQEGLG
jgi:hypothetical protein